MFNNSESQNKAKQGVQKWICHNCTLENELQFVTCQVCEEGTKFMAERIQTFQEVKESNIEQNSQNLSLKDQKENEKEEPQEQNIFTIKWTCDLCTKENTIEKKICERCQLGKKPAQICRVQKSGAQKKITKQKQVSNAEIEAPLTPEGNVKSEKDSFNDFSILYLQKEIEQMKQQINNQKQESQEQMTQLINTYEKDIYERDNEISRLNIQIQERNSVINQEKVEIKEPSRVISVQEEEIKNNVKEQSRIIEVQEEIKNNEESDDSFEVILKGQSIIEQQNKQNFLDQQFIEKQREIFQKSILADNQSYD